MAHLGGPSGGTRLGGRRAADEEVAGEGDGDLVGAGLRWDGRVGDGLFGDGDGEGREI